MVKKNLLKAKIIEKETNYAECSTALSVTTSSFYNKVNDRTDFKIKEVTLLSKFLKLTNEEIINIFLN